MFTVAVFCFIYIGLYKELEQEKYTYVAIHKATQLFRSECIHAAWRIDTYIDIIVYYIYTH